LDRGFRLRASSIRSGGSENVAAAEPAWDEEPVGQDSVIVLQLREIAEGGLLHPLRGDIDLLATIQFRV
jgi:hypothetical protein